MSTNKCSRNNWEAWDVWTTSCPGASPLAVLVVDRTLSCPLLCAPGSPVLSNASIYYKVNSVHVPSLSVSQKSKNVLNRSLNINCLFFSLSHNIWDHHCQNFSFRFWPQNSLDSRTFFPPWHQVSLTVLIYFKIWSNDTQQPVSGIFYW